MSKVNLYMKQNYLSHKFEEEDEVRRRIYKHFEIDGSTVHGNPTDTPPKWLHSIMIKEMNYFHALMKGQSPDSEYKPLTDGTAARNSIATADALTLSLREDRKVSVSEVTENRT